MFTRSSSPERPAQVSCSELLSLSKFWDGHLPQTALFVVSIARFLSFFLHSKGFGKPLRRTGRVIFRERWLTEHRPMSSRIADSTSYSELSVKVFPDSLRSDLDSVLGASHRYRVCQLPQAARQGRDDKVCPLCGSFSEGPQHMWLTCSHGRSHMHAI